MYTAQEIKDEAKSQSRLVFWLIILVFGIPMGFLTYTTLSDPHAPVSLIRNTIWGDVAVFFGALIMKWVSEINTKHDCRELNAEEERNIRLKHYKRVEELLENLKKEYENK